ncbi:MAG: hypothetical protein ABF946_12025, partial [Acetobacter papayae]
IIHQRNEIFFTFRRIIFQKSLIFSGKESPNRLNDFHIPAAGRRTGSGIPDRQHGATLLYQIQAPATGGRYIETNYTATLICGVAVRRHLHAARTTQTEEARKASGIRAANDTE